MKRSSWRHPQSGRSPGRNNYTIVRDVSESNIITEDIPNAVSPGELLAQHEHKRSDEPRSDTGRDAFFPGHAFGQVQLFINGGSNFRHLVDNLGGLDLLISDVCQRFEGFFVSAFLDEPSWRLCQEEEANEHEAAWDLF